MSTPHDPSDDLTHLSPEMIERYERALRHPHAGVVKFMEKAYAAAASGDNAGLAEADRIRVYLSIYNTVQELTKGSADAAQAATDRLWGNLSAQAKRDMAANPGAAAGIVSDAMRSDPVLAAKLPSDGAAVAPPEKPVFFDGLGRDPFDRMIAGNRVAGLYSGNSTANYSSLNGSTYDPVRGIGTLTTQNFTTSPFAGSGLTSSDIPTIKLLAAQGFSTEAIRTAGRDREALGLSGQQSAENLAYIRRADPRQIKNLHDYRDRSFDAAVDLAAAKGEAAKAEAEGRPEDAQRARKIIADIEEQQRKERDRLAAGEKDPAIRHRIEQEAEKIWRNNEQAATAAVQAGMDPEVIKDFRKNPDDPEARKAFYAARATAAVAAGGDPKKTTVLADLDERLAADKKQKAEQIALNDKKIDVSAAVNKKGDDLFANMMDDSAPPKLTQLASCDAKGGDVTAVAPFVTADKPASTSAETQVARVETPTDGTNKAKRLSRNPKGFQ